MRGVNETIARMANTEENCKGRFWEGRFKSQALLDEVALLSCMAYVDLNPVRAGMAADLTESDYTSIQQRIHDYAKYKNVKSNDEETLMQRVERQREIKKELGLSNQSEAPLMPFDGSSSTNIHTALPFTREDYIALVDESGRCIREGKRGLIAANIPCLITRLGIDPDAWLDHVRQFGRRYGPCAGAMARIVEFAESLGKCWGKGLSISGSVYACSLDHSRGSQAGQNGQLEGIVGNP